MELNQRLLVSYEEFDKPDRVLPRQVRTSDGKIASLVEFVQSKRRGVSAAYKRSFGGVCVHVTNDDGMTWSAEMVRKALEMERPGQVYAVNARPTQYDWPLIALLVGKLTFLRLALRYRLTKAFSAYRVLLDPLDGYHFCDFICLLCYS